MDGMLLAGAECEPLAPLPPLPAALPHAVAARAMAATPSVPRMRMVFRITILLSDRWKIVRKCSPRTAHWFTFAAISFASQAKSGSINQPNLTDKSAEP